MSHGACNASSSLVPLIHVPTSNVNATPSRLSIYKVNEFLPYW